MVGPSSQISKLLLSLLFLLLIFYIIMDVQLYLRIHNYPIERNYHNAVNESEQFLLLPLQLTKDDEMNYENYNVHSNNPYDYHNNEKNSENTINSKRSLSSGAGSGTGSGTDDNSDSNSSSSGTRNHFKTSNEKTVLKRKTNTGYSSRNNGNNRIRTSTSNNLLLNQTIVTTTKSNNKQYISTSITKEQKHYQYNKIKRYEDVVWIPCNINPLCHITVKAVLLDHTNHYLFAPMATIFDNIIGFSRTKFITANMISYFHVFVAILAAKFIASDNLSYRRIGVVLFEFRTFLDDLDGHVARVKKNIRGERSEVGTAGYYIDGICDSLGCIALMLGIYIYLKNNPPRRGYTQLQSILPITDDINLNSNINLKQSSSSSSLIPSSTSASTSSLCGETGVIYRVKITKRKIFKKVGIFTGQLLCSSLAWNRYIAAYQSMLENNNVKLIQFNRQNIIFKSNIFFIIAWLWRLFNVHSLLHCILLSIFCDKLWSFLKMIQYSGIFILFISMCATEMHILEVQNFIFNSITTNINSNYNNTSL